MPKSKKDKVAGLEKHKQLQREKELKRKQRRQVSLPAKHTKKKQSNRRYAATKLF
jgi:hypothetical protein